MKPFSKEQLLVWSEAYQMKTSGGFPFEWEDHVFLMEPFTDFHHHQGINKSAQVGFSEMMILKTIFLASQLGLNIGYSLHSSKDMDNFTKTKFDAILRANPYLGSLIDGNMEKKIVKYQGAERFIHLVGAYNSASSSMKEQSTVGISFTADVLIHDEASRSDQYVLDQLRSRILNSDYKWRWLFDNPLYPGTGADDVYTKSDQRHWIIKCRHCNYRQYLDWYKLSEHPFQTGTNHCFVDDTKELFICGKCGKALNDADRLDGEWVAKRPKIVDYRGYWINQLCYVQHSAHDILVYEKEMTPSVFMNMVLGKPYIGSDITITRDAIIENYATRSTEPVRGMVAMGVDGRVGEYQYELRDEQGMFDFGRLNSIKEVEQLRNTWDAIMVIDLHPNTGEVKRLAAKYPGKVYYALFRPEADQAELAKFSPTNDRNLVLIRREDMFDVIADKYNNNEAPHNISNHSELREFADEYSNLVRDTKSDALGNMRPVWIKISDACDFPFADLYAWTAMQKIKRGRGFTVLPKSRMVDPTNVVEVDKLTPKEVADQMIKNASRIRLK